MTPSPGTPGEGWGEGSSFIRTEEMHPLPNPLPEYRAREDKGESIMADTRLRWGILGTGNIAKQFAAGLRTAERSQAAAVASRRAASAEEFGETFHIDKRHGSYEKLLSDRSVDAIYLSLPNSLHHEWTIRS